MNNVDGIIEYEKKKIIDVDIVDSSMNFDKNNDNRVVAMKMNNFPLLFLSKYMYICVYTYSRCEVVTTKRRIERAKSLKQEVLSLTSTPLLKQNASFNCNGRIKRGEKKGGEEQEETIDVL